MAKEVEQKVSKKSGFFERLGRFVFFIFLAGFAFVLWLIGVSLLLLSFIKIAAVLFILVLVGGIFIVRKKGIFCKIIGIGLIVLFLIGGLLVLLYYIGSPKEVKGAEKEQFLQAVNPLIDNFFEGYNEKNYVKFSRDFNNELKKNFTEDKLVLAYDNFGMHVSKNNARVFKRSYTIYVTYESEFQKAGMDLSIYFEKLNETYLISGLNFNPTKTKEINVDLKINSEKTLQNITTSKVVYSPAEGHNYLYLDVSLNNTNDFEINVKGFRYETEKMYYSSIDFALYPDLREFCEQVIGEIQPYEIKKGCIVFQLPKDIEKGRVVVVL